MSKTNESKLYNLIKKTIKKAHFTRVETHTINGVSDLNCVYKGQEFWLELKANDIKNCNLSKYQINWILQHQQHGGLVFILNKAVKQSALKLYRLEPCGLVREVLCTTPDARGVIKVFEYITTTA